MVHFFENKKIIHLVIRKIRGYFVLKSVKAHKNEIFIGGPTRLSNKTTISKNPNFNGMVVNGHGEVIFADNFHSGTGCLIITSNHNYDSGTKIP